ncbi:MAG: hypothetical protein MHMPM18_002038 [Marteilia pararefringens]
MSLIYPSQCICSYDSESDSDNSNSQLYSTETSIELMDRLALDLLADVETYCVSKFNGSAVDQYNIEGIQSKSVNIANPLTSTEISGAYCSSPQISKHFEVVAKMRKMFDDFSREE